MPELLADVNAAGSLDAVLAVCGSAERKEILAALGVAALTFDAVGLDVTTPDGVLWQFCQERGLLLVTGNRNRKGPDSLQATIVARNTLTTLPVLTLADPGRLTTDRAYAQQT